MGLILGSQKNTIVSDSDRKAFEESLNGHLTEVTDIMTSMERLVAELDVLKASSDDFAVPSNVKW